MTREQIIARLREVNRKEVARKTGIPYGYLSKVVYGEVKNPGSRQIDTLRDYFDKRKGLTQ